MQYELYQQRNMWQALFASKISLEAKRKKNERIIGGEPIYSVEQEVNNLVYWVQLTEQQVIIKYIAPSEISSQSFLCSFLSLFCHLSCWFPFDFNSNPLKELIYLRIYYWKIKRQITYSLPINHIVEKERDKNNKIAKMVINFGAGPAKLPQEVFVEVQKELLNYANTGLSVMEISHRSKDYIAVHDAALQSVRDVLYVYFTFSSFFFFFCQSFFHRLYIRKIAKTFDWLINLITFSIDSFV